jgi:subtilisin family serine protease
MTARVDPRLLQLREEQRELRVTEGPDATLPPPRVIVTFTGELADIEALGFTAESVLGKIASGWIPIDALEALIGAPGIEQVSAPTLVKPRLNKSVADINADDVHTGSFNLNGSGVVVGVIDTGIDIYHQCFRKDDGTTRILALLDRSIHSEHIEIVGGPTSGNFRVQYTAPGGTTTEQSANILITATAAQIRTALEALPSINPGDIATSGGPLPNTPVRIDFLKPQTDPDAPLEFFLNGGSSLVGGTNPGVRVWTGREFTRSEINDALSHPDQPFPHKDLEGHGTHVAGTAAGDGSQAEKCESAFKYVGVAPGADLLITKTGRSDGIIQGIRWIREKAQRADQPAVINISLGSHAGDHDGTDDIAVAIDNALNETPIGFAVVVSAGNERDEEIHARKALAANGTWELEFDVPGKDKQGDFLTVSYPPGAARLTLQVTSPNGSAGTVVAPGSTGNDTLERSRVTVTSTEPTATDRGVIFISIRPPAGSDKPSISSGDWKLTLTETAGTAATVHAWINDSKDDPYPTWNSDVDPNTTIGTTAASRNAITVGAYQPGGTDLADFSSAGPTSDGRVKPDVAAPGQAITAPRSKLADTPSCCDCCHEFYTEKQGTSMSSPHVAGLVALMFQRNRLQRFDDIKRILIQSSRRPPGAVDGAQNANDNLWGAGRIDALAAVTAVPAPAGGGGGPFGPHLLTAGLLLPIHVFTIDRLQELVARYTATPTGRLVALLVSDHLDEVYRLINTNRFVATCWHRLGGPQLVREAIRAGADEPFRVPHEVDGRPLRVQLARMLRMLDRFGSERLRADVALYGPLVLQLPGTSLDDLELVLAG